MDYQTKLILRFDDDDDGSGKLSVEASSKGFCGHGGAYFAKTELEAFANSLAMYPLSTENLPKIAGGYWSQEREGVLDQELLGISVYTIDRRGNLGIQVRIATEDWARLESQHGVKIEILTNYQPLVELSRKLLALLDGRIEAAIL